MGPKEVAAEFHSSSLITPSVELVLAEGSVGSIGPSTTVLTGVTRGSSGVSVSWRVSAAYEPSEIGEATINAVQNGTNVFYSMGVTVNRDQCALPLEGYQATYNGMEQTPNLGTDSSIVLSGDTSAIDVGTYTVYADLPDELHEWVDGTSDQKVVEWSIVDSQVADFSADPLGHGVISADTLVDGQSVHYGDLYIEQGCTLTVSGSLIVNGDVYVFGTLANTGSVTVNGTLNALHYGSFMSAGNYDYGYIKNSGSLTSDSLNITDGYLGVPVPPVIHVWNEGMVLKEASHTEEGLLEKTCTVCGETIVEPIAKLDEPIDPDDGQGEAPGSAPEEPVASDPSAGDPGSEAGSTSSSTDDGQGSTGAGTAAESQPEPTLSTVVTGEVSPDNPVSASAVEEQIVTAKSDADPKGSGFGLLQAKGAAKSKTSVKVTWKKVKGATKYVVYGNKCGKGNRYVKLKAVKGKSYTQKSLKAGTYYKYLVVAVRGDAAIATSKTIHVATKGGKAGNVKSVSVAAKANKGKLTLKKGASFKLKAKAAAQSKNLKVKKHRALAYESSDPSVAAVSKKGVVKAKAKGKCTVFAYAQDGTCKAVKVTVK